MKTTGKTAGRGVAAVLLAACAWAAPALAANWYWDGNGGAAGGSLGGDGPWNSTSLVWRTHPNNPLTNWVAGSSAIFSGDPGTVTLEEDITVSSGMSVHANMTFGGPYTLRLSGGTHVTGGAVTATVNCAVQLLYNAGIRYNYLINGNISDDGANRSIVHHFDTLTLNGSNSFGGGVALNSGTLVVGNDHALGTGTLSLGYDGAVLEAGGGDRTVTNRLAWNWNWRLNFQGTNNLTFTATQILNGTASPWPRFNIVETNAVLTYGGLMRDTRFHTALVKEGPGTMAIQGPYDASYGTIVTGGTFIVNGMTTVLQNNYGYSVFPGATLGGTGTITLAASGSTCTVHQAGALAPGASADPGVGTLTFNGPVRLDENAILKWDYEDGAGDLVDVNGDLYLPLAATVTVNRISGELPAIPTLFTANALQGPGALDVSGWIVDGLAKYAVAIQNNDVILVVVPPRGTMIMFR